MTSTGQKTILVVDDEELLRNAIAYDFKHKGYRTLTAGGGREAFEIVKRERIDIVLSDIKMPDGDGIELLKNIKSHNAGVPVLVFITAFSDAFIEEAYDLGACAIISKPFDRKELQDLVSKSLTPPRARWLTENPAEGAKYDIEILPDLETAITGRLAGIGHGGMFVALDGKPPKNQSEIRFRMGSGGVPPAGFTGRGVVRWVRSAAPPAKPACGIEFISLDKATMEAVLGIINSSKTISFIPRAP